tara:strand:+ start:193 stop:339 length:147 start_codon:yes stop_codon:yes gene_type:complete
MLLMDWYDIFVPIEASLSGIQFNEEGAMIDVGIPWVDIVSLHMKHKNI